MRFPRFLQVLTLEAMFLGLAGCTVAHSNSPIYHNLQLKDEVVRNEQREAKSFEEYMMCEAKSQLYTVLYMEKTKMSVSIVDLERKMKYLSLFAMHQEQVEEQLGQKNVQIQGIANACAGYEWFVRAANEEFGNINDLAVESPMVRATVKFFEYCNE